MALQLNRRYVKYFFEPVAESFEEGFWEAVKRRELVFQRCGQCREWLHPPRPMCHKCKSFDLRWEKSTGKGKIYSYVTFTREVNPLYVVPFEVVLVEMDDEKPVRMVANMLDTKPEELYIGMPVELDFFDVTPKQPIPIFKKRTA
ncbi:MAG: OB-fold domain-containing protein [Deltaproteobacteria bacterium]|nr:OB-fold domain-containing protein [Deltaproteobacteria bacterium]